MSSRDEISAARSRRRRKYQFRRFLALMISLALIVAVIIVVNSINVFTFRDIADYFKSAFAGGDGYPVMLESTKPLKVTAMKNANAVLTDSELLVKGKRGRELLRAAHAYSNPSMQASGSRILLYDGGNRGFSVYNRTGKLFFSESEYPIISAGIADDGTIAVLTRGDRSASQLKVYSGVDYTVMFTWYGAKGFPLACGFAEGGKQAYAASLVAVSGGLDTVFTLIDVAKTQQLAETQIPGVVMRVYNSEDGYTVVTDKGVFLLSFELKLISDYRFSRVPVLRASYENGYLALVFGDNQQQDINYLVLLSGKLEEQLKLEGIGAADDLLMASDRLYLLSSGVIHEIKLDGSYSARYETQLKVIKVFLSSGRVSVLLSDRIEQPEEISSA